MIRLLNVGNGFNGTPAVFVVQPDGKLIIGGSFSQFNGALRASIARLNYDGSLDTSFNAGSPVNSVASLCLQSDGKIYVGGDFTSFNNQPYVRIVRLHSDGKIDSTFSTGTGPDWTVLSIAIQPDNKMLIGGFFNSVNGTVQRHLARLHPNGNLDTTFTPNFPLRSGGAGDGVQAIVIQSDQKIVVGGRFYTLNNLSRLNLARINTNGTTDTSFMTETAANQSVRTVALTADEKILVGGDFTTIGGLSRGRVARLNTNGAVDLSFDAGSGANSSVLSLAPLSNGQFFAGGGFRFINGISSSGLAKFEETGTLDTSFNPTPAFNARSHAFSELPDGRILVGGYFSWIGYTSRARIVRIHPNGTLDNSFDPGAGPNDEVRCLSLQTNGSVLIAGTFSSVNGISRGRIARLHDNGTLDSGFGSGGGATNGTIYALKVQSNGTMFAAGNFKSVLSTNYNALMRLDAQGQLDPGFKANIAESSSILTMAQQVDGKLVVGGSFTKINGTNRVGIARINLDGSLDSGFDPGSGPKGDFPAVLINALALQPDGKIVVGGNFTNFNGIARNRIVRLLGDGTVDVTFHPGTGANEQVLALHIEADGKIMVGGWFTNFNGFKKHRIVRLNPDGSIDSSFAENAGGSAANDKTIGSVEVIHPQADGKLLVSGNFRQFNGQAQWWLARIHGAPVQAPALRISVEPENLVISWPKQSVKFDLQTRSTLGADTDWAIAGQSPVTNENAISVSIPWSGSNAFYRLKAQ